MAHRVVTDEQARASSRRLGVLMHRLRGVAGPTPEDLVDVDLSRHQLRALFIITRHGPMAVGRLADATGASLASTSSLADRLVRAGYLERAADPADRRRVLLVASEPGRATVDQVMTRYRTRFEQLVEAMSPEGREALETGLIDLIRAADELGLPSDSPSHGDHT